MLPLSLSSVMSSFSKEWSLFLRFYRSLKFLVAAVTSYQDATMNKVHNKVRLSLVSYSFENTGTSNPASSKGTLSRQCCCICWQGSCRKSSGISLIILRKWKCVPFQRKLLALYCRTQSSAFEMAFLTSCTGELWALWWNSLYIYTLPSDLWVRAFPINLKVQQVEPWCWWALGVW